MKTMIVVDNLRFSESNYELIKEVNDVIDNSIHDVSVAVMNFSEKVINTKFAVMNPTEIDSFDDGVLVALDIQSTKDILSSKTNSKKVLYLWDIEWFYKKIQYKELFSILQNEELTVITRSESHSKILKNIVGKKTQTFEKFNLESIWNLLKETEKE
jgi:hypothetical protein